MRGKDIDRACLVQFSVCHNILVVAFLTVSKMDYVSVQLSLGD